MNGGRMILVDVSSEVKIINELCSCRAAARTTRRVVCIAVGGGEGRALSRRTRARSRERVDGSNIDGGLLIRGPGSLNRRRSRFEGSRRIVANFECAKEGA